MECASRRCGGEPKRPAGTPHSPMVLAWVDAQSTTYYNMWYETLGEEGGREPVSGGFVKWNFTITPTRKLAHSSSMDSSHVLSFGTLPSPLYSFGGKSAAMVTSVEPTIKITPPMDRAILVRSDIIKSI